MKLDVAHETLSSMRTRSLALRRKTDRLKVKLQLPPLLSSNLRLMGETHSDRRRKNLEDDIMTSVENRSFEGQREELKDKNRNEQVGVERQSQNVNSRGVTTFKQLRNLDSHILRSHRQKTRNNIISIIRRETDTRIPVGIGEEENRLKNGRFQRSPSSSSGMDPRAPRSKASVEDARIISKACDETSNVLCESTCVSFPHNCRNRIELQRAQEKLREMLSAREKISVRNMQAVSILARCFHDRHRGVFKLKPISSSSTAGLWYRELQKSPGVHQKESMRLDKRSRLLISRNTSHQLGWKFTMSVPPRIRCGCGDSVLLILRKLLFSLHAFRKQVLQSGRYGSKDIKLNLKYITPTRSGNSWLLPISMETSCLPSISLSSITHSQDTTVHQIINYRGYKNTSK